MGIKKPTINNELLIGIIEGGWAEEKALHPLSPEPYVSSKSSVSLLLLWALCDGEN